jgi:hypothetical protein
MIAAASGAVRRQEKKMKNALRYPGLACTLAGACLAHAAGLGIPVCPNSQGETTGALADPESGVENDVRTDPLPNDPPCVLLSSLQIQPGTESDDICYGSPDSEPPGYHWHEASDGGAVLYRSFDYFRPELAAQDPKKPLIVYFHPNGVKSHLVSPKQMWKNVVQPALAMGWAVATVEFRHPVTDAYLEDPIGSSPWAQGLPYSPTNDTGYALQYLRENARKLGFDPQRVVALGYSRGSLSLWQALQPDMARGTYPYSSVPGAFYGYQAQTTYQCDEYGNDFITTDNGGQDDRAYFIAQCRRDNPRWREFGSAMQSITPRTTLPIMIRYADPFWVHANGTVKLNTLWAIQHYNKPLYPNDPGQWNDTEHYPDMGRELQQVYVAAAGANAPIDTADCRNDTVAGFADWVGYVKGLLGE